MQDMLILYLDIAINVKPVADNCNQKQGTYK